MTRLATAMSRRSGGRGQPSQRRSALSPGGHASASGCTSDFADTSRKSGLRQMRTLTGHAVDVRLPSICGTRNIKMVCSHCRGVRELRGPVEYEVLSGGRFYADRGYPAACKGLIPVGCVILRAKSCAY